jgi:hypothetical protein
MTESRARAASDVLPREVRASLECRDAALIGFHGFKTAEKTGAAKALNRLKTRRP